MEPHGRTEPPHDGNLKARLGEELVKYAVISTYLAVCFGALLLYKSALLQQDGIHAVHLGTALGKALIIGKFLLIGDSLRIGRRLPSRLLAGRIALRVLLLLLLLVVLTVAEELLVGLVRGHAMAVSWAELGSKPLGEVVAELLLMLLILVPLVAAGELNRALGPGTLRRLLTSNEGSGEVRPQAGPAADDERR